MYDLTNFSLRNMTECGAALRELGSEAKNMEEAANRLVRYLYDHLIDGQTGERACVLVRFFKTQAYEKLDTDLRRFARGASGNHAILPDTKCLTLLATAGAKPEWNSRETSVGHKAIPLSSEQVVERSPMISQLVKQFGLEISNVLWPDPNLLVDWEQRSFNVFYVPRAVDSPYISAQEEFVIPFGVKSALSFGGVLPSGNLFAIIVFSKLHITLDTADMFQTLALNAKMAVLPFVGEPTFA
jgi:hypothetical protein